MDQPVNSVCEEEVFREIYEKQSTSLRNFFYYSFGDFEKANDYVQEAFVKLWNNCSNIIFSKARSYLFTVAKRLFLDSKQREQVALKFRERQRLDLTSESPDFVFEEQEFKVRLEGAISALPDRQREIFLLNRIDGMPYKEIAEVMEVSIKTVEKHMATALRMLKSNVEELLTHKI
ncbi:MAG: sigma-70 family RNA polymerase sigma factor [Cyclobacteriaceae bacterium]|nr:sigma-70 family RNA polymerase sigma factor [Cyclobacteriaceae bacterium HetDA_MAG_MS6]